MLRDDHGDVSLILSQKPCPQCGAQAIQLNEAKPTLPVEIATAIRDADLTPDQIGTLARVIREADPEISPRELADRVQIPAASPLITVASRAGKNWIALLSLILTVTAIYVAHTDVQQAHHDAERAIQQSHMDAEKALREAREPSRSTGTLSQEEVNRIAAQIEQQLARNK
jgi:hypothetical protein